MYDTRIRYHEYCGHNEDDQTVLLTLLQDDTAHWDVIRREHVAENATLRKVLVDWHIPEDSLVEIEKLLIGTKFAGHVETFVVPGGTPMAFAFDTTRLRALSRMHTQKNQWVCRGLLLNDDNCQFVDDMESDRRAVPGVSFRSLLSGSDGLAPPLFREAKKRHAKVVAAKTTSRARMRDAADQQPKARRPDTDRPAEPRRPDTDRSAATRRPSRDIAVEIIPLPMRQAPRHM